jgi:hypothetical protein
MMTRVFLIVGATILFLLPFGQSARALTGSYAKSCDTCSVTRPTIACSCQKRNGWWNHTSIDYTKCPNESLANNDGVLVCGK